MTKGFDARLANRPECPKVKSSCSQPGVESLNYSVVILGTLGFPLLLVVAYTITCSVKPLIILAMQNFRCQLIIKTSIFR